MNKIDNTPRKRMARIIKLRDAIDDMPQYWQREILKQCWSNEYNYLFDEYNYKIQEDYYNKG